MSTFRNALGAVSRALPSFRGKSHLGDRIGCFLTNTDSEEDCIVKIRMWDGSLMTIDLRSRTERWAYWTGEYDRNVISRLSM